MKRYNHNVWCTSDINKSLPEGSLFPGTPADFFGGAQDFCLLCLFSFLKWFRPINSRNAVAGSATKSKMPGKVVHYTDNLSVVYSWRVHSGLNSTQYNSWCLSVLLAPGCLRRRRWLFHGSCVLPSNSVQSLRYLKTSQIGLDIHVWATHWSCRVGVSCRLHSAPFRHLSVGVYTWFSCLSSH